MPSRSDDPSIVAPPEGRFTEQEMARWRQHVGVRCVFRGAGQYEDAFMLVRARHADDARRDLEQHGFDYWGRLAFNVSPESAPGWLMGVSLMLGRII
jgi:hypothetical protein